MNYKETVQAMDILVVYNPKSWLHRLIKGVTGYKAGHIAIYVGDGMIYDANSAGVQRRKWRNYKSYSKIYICRYMLMTESIELKIREYLFSKENDRYSFLQLAVILIKNIFQLPRSIDASKKAEMCSELAAGAFKYAGISLCDKPDYDTYPGDILHSDKLWSIKC